MSAVLNKQGHGAIAPQLQVRLFRPGVRSPGRVQLARQLDLIQERLRLHAVEGVDTQLAWAAVEAFRGELARTILRKDVLQRHINAMQGLPGVWPLVSELRHLVASSA